MDDKTIWSDLGHSGIEKDVFDMGDVRDVNVICPKPNNFYNYNRFKNKPQINGVTLEGNKTTEELGIHEYDDTEIREMISDIEDEQEVQDTNIANNAEGIEEINRGLVNYSLVNETGYRIDLEMDSQTFDLVAKLYDKNGNLLSTSSDIDLPLESLVVSVEYDSVNKEIVITLESGEVTRVPVGDLVEGLVSVEDLEEALEGYYTKTDMDDLLSPINSDISDLQDDIDGLQSDIDSINAEQTTQNENIAQNAADISTLNDDLANYSLITETGSQVALTLDNTNYKMKAILKDKNGNTIYTSNEIDLPMESVVINGFYDNTTKEVVLTLVNGSTIRFSVASLVSGLVSDEDLTAILGNYYTSAEIDTLLVDYVKFTDYATSDKAGVIKATGNYGVSMQSSGQMYATNTDYSTYQNASQGYFVGKGTLENVIAGKELVNQETLDESQAEQDTNIEDNRKDIDFIEDLIDQFDTVDGNGTDLELDDTAEYKMVKLDMLGNSSQFSTTGKNLLNVESDLEFTRSKTVSVNIPAGIYYITNNGTTTSDDTTRVTIRFNNNNKTYNVSVNDSVGVTLTTDETTIYLYSKVDYPTSAGVSATIKNLMISVDGGTYEPYTNGASPNPSYPQNVKSVTGENSIVVQNKNLLNIVGTRTHNGVTTTGTSDGKMVSVGTTGSNAYFNMTENYKPTNIPAGDYIFSIQSAIAYGVQIILYDANQTRIIDGTINRGSTNINITISSDASYYRLAMVSVGSGMSVDVAFNPMLRLSTVADSSFAPHEEQNYQLSLGNIELNSSSDGTIRDQIVGSKDNWFKREYIRKYTFTGQEDFNVHTTTETYIRVKTTGAEFEGLINGGLSFCNYFSNDNTPGGISVINAFRIANHGSGANIKTQYWACLDINDFPDVTTFKNWLATKYNNNTPVITYNPRAEYVDIPITDTTLVNQLNDIYDNAHSYNGTTNITTTYASGNEQMYLDINAIRQLSGYVTEDELSDYVKNTDYATNDKGGTIKTSSGYATVMLSDSGILTAGIKSYALYEGASNYMFISKGTLENVISGKELVNQTTLEESQAEQDENIGTNRKDIDFIEDLIDQFESVDGTGTDLKLDDTIEYKMMKLDMLGNSSQESTSGHQLFNANLIANEDIIVGENGEQITMPIASSGDGAVNTNKTLGELCPTLKVGDVAYVKFTRNLSQGYNTKIALGSNKAGWNTTSELTITQQWLDSEVWLYGNNYNAGETSQCILSDFRIITNSDYTWERYTGGIPAPNPSYPYMPSRVTGENSIVLQNENLLDYSKIVKGRLDNGVLGYANYTDSYSYTSNTFTFTTNRNWGGVVSDYIIVMPSSPYYFKFTTDISNTLISIAEYDENKIWIKDNHPYSSQSITMTENTKYIRIWFTNATTGTITYSNVSVTKGSTAPSEYVGHKEQVKPLSFGNMEFNSSPDGTIRDQIVGTKDNWYKREYIGKYTVNGTENIIYASVTQGSLFRFAIDKSIENKISYSNYYSGIPNASTRENGKFYYNKVINQFDFIDNRYTNVNDFENWLREQYNNNTPVIVWYPKEEYVEIPITDTTLIEQLNDIYDNIHSYNGTTNITTTYEDGNEQMIIDASALKSSILDYVTQDELDTTLADYVKNTDYANYDTGGVVKTSSGYGTGITGSGYLTSSTRTYEQYSSADNNVFISKGTLENVITGKELVNQTALGESQAEQNEKIDSLNSLVNQLPAVEKTGTDISLEDVLNYRLIKFLPQGNSSQFSTEGINISNFTRLSSGGITYSENDITIINPTTRYLYGTNCWNLINNSDLSGKTYSFLVIANGSTVNAWSFYVAKTGNSYAVGKTYTANSNFNNDIYVGRVALQEGEVFANIRVESDSADSATNLSLKIMVVEGSYTADTIPPYEPYTNGESPNPDYPQDIKTVTGENSVVLQNENLFSSEWEQGTINATTGANQGASNEIRTKDFILVTPNQNYAIKRNIATSNIKMRCYDVNKNYLGSGTNYVNLVQGSTPTNPMSTGNTFCVISFKDEVRYFKMCDNSNNLSTQYTMVKGDTPLSEYVEHKEQVKTLSLGNIELNSSPDGTIRDQIVGSKDNWYKREYIGKVVLNGSENWDYTNGVFNLSTTARYLLSNWLCNALTFGGTATNTSTAYQNGNNKISVNTSGSRFYIRIDDITSVSDFKTYLSNNNIILNAPLAEYTDIPITDTTLINQLNDIYENAHSYNGITNITSTYEDGNEQMVIDASAVRQADDYVTDDDIVDYVKNTDYATSSKGGVIRTGNAFELSNGITYAYTYSYNTFLNQSNGIFISKGTLENVIAGKDLTTKAYVDGLVGDISDALDAINGENLEGGA